MQDVLLQPGTYFVVYLVEALVNNKALDPAPCQATVPGICPSFASLSEAKEAAAALCFGPFDTGCTVVSPNGDEVSVSVDLDFIPEPDPIPVPAVSTLGLLAMSGLLGISSFAFTGLAARRRFANPH